MEESRFGEGSSPSRSFFSGLNLFNSVIFEFKVTKA